MPSTLFTLNKPIALAVSGAALLLGSISAQAGGAPQVCGMDVELGNPQASAVLSDTQVPTMGNTLYSYNFTVCNLSDPGFLTDDVESQRGDAIRDWELPWDPNAGITNIRVPDNWSWSIETRDVVNPLTGWGNNVDGAPIEWQDPNDPFYDPAFAHHTQVLHFYTGCGDNEVVFANASLTQAPVSAPGTQRDLDCQELGNNWIYPIFNRAGPPSLAGFGFDAPIGPIAAPYQASWVDLPVNTGDPDFPSAALTPGFFAVPVPEPSTVALMSLGLFAASRKRKSISE